MTQPKYDIPGAQPHGPEWEWKPTKGGYWELKGTNDKGYNCSEFAMAKIEGRPPRYGGDGSQTTETDEIEQELKKKGFKEAGSSGKCGSGPGKMSQCVVLYFSISDGKVSKEPYHVEVFDPIHGDWGGKGAAGLPIRHRKDPNEYPHDPEERKKTKAVFFCKQVEPPPKPISDSDLHKGATKLPKPAPPAPPPEGPSPPVPPYLPNRFLWIWRVLWAFGGIVLGWLLHAWLGS